MLICTLHIIYILYINIHYIYYKYKWKMISRNDKKKIILISKHNKYTT